MDADLDGSHADRGEDSSLDGVSFAGLTNIDLSDVLGDTGSNQDLDAALDTALPADQTAAATAPRQDAAQGDHAALDALSDQHQLVQQIIDAGKQGTDLI